MSCREHWLTFLVKLSAHTRQTDLQPERPMSKTHNVVCCDIISRRHKPTHPAKGNSHASNGVRFLDTCKRSTIDEHIDHLWYIVA